MDVNWPDFDKQLNTIKRDLSETYCFVTDWNGCHYFIPVVMRKRFFDMSEVEVEFKSEVEVEFKKYRSLAPCNYMFTERIILKENIGEEKHDSIP